MDERWGIWVRSGGCGWGAGVGYMTHFLNWGGGGSFTNEGCYTPTNCVAQNPYSQSNKRILGSAIFSKLMDGLLGDPRKEEIKTPS